MRQENLEGETGEKDAKIDMHVTARAGFRIEAKNDTRSEDSDVKTSQLIYTDSAVTLHNLFLSS